ncbi:translational activator of cytochrome c oxidase 1 [Lycorma delicatula]|uniref:translational activator of cytochrome c oxidase 1 n=1 Tax=Lycorma delicatula TaxID=130591 RepID=UPI003F51A2F3
MFSSYKFSIGCVQTVCKRYAGHSKWQNIRHTKAAKDGEKSRLYIKIGQQIKIAIQETGNADPTYNSKLSQAIDVARVNHVPSATIQSFINQAKNSSDKSKVLWIDLKGPRGCFVIIQTLTSNPKRTKDLITNIIKKHSLTVENNLRNQFTHKGIVVAKPNSNFKDIEELCVEHAIEIGAEDVKHEPEENVLKFICEPIYLKQVSDKLKEIGYEIEDADDHFLPNSTVSLDEVVMQDLSNAIDKIYTLPDVIKVYDNIE